MEVDERSATADRGNLARGTNFGTDDGMDARLPRIAVAIFIVLLVVAPLRAAEYKTDNFVVTAPTEELAKKCAMTAERWRVRLAKEWLDKELPNWYRPCPIQVQVGQIGAGGQTTFRFAPNPETGRNEVYGWDMQVQGTEERILDSVIPHEVSHTVFASHFRRPLPRWADEGAATLAEHESEQRRQDLTLNQVWNTNRIPLKKLLSMTEYPSDMQDVMTLYAQGYSLANYLVQRGGRARFLELLAYAEEENWKTAFEELYGIDDINRLESTWGEWVLAGSRPLPRDIQVASAESEQPRGGDEVLRGQSPDRSAESGTSVAVAQPERNAASPAKFKNFLPPAPRTSPAKPALAEIMATGEEETREPRPEPLGAIGEQSSTASRESAAIETGHEQSGGSRAALPRRARVDQASQARERDFFSSRGGVDSDSGKPESFGIGFPAPRSGP